MFYESGYSGNLGNKVLAYNKDLNIEGTDSRQTWNTWNTSYNNDERGGGEKKGKTVEEAASGEAERGSLGRERGSGSAPLGSQRKTDCKGCQQKTPQELRVVNSYFGKGFKRGHEV